MLVNVFEIHLSNNNNNNKKNEDVEGGTEAFPDLGAHCQHPLCRQLDFLPFHCDRCRQTFCIEHRTYKSHDCTRPDDKNRKVHVCNRCSTSIETTGYFRANEQAIIDKHLSSKECDPAKKNKSRCPARRCKEKLTFSNNVVCKFCNVKFCLNHRFPASHACNRGGVSLANAASVDGGLSALSLGSRNGNDCAKSGRKSGQSSSASGSRSVQAC
ncbi:hypothetical protein RND81_08G173800 [Saponaria officinalis]|uniref:AN1-type domain-containing protein n=1 Tax=Saponaria officinalis TaxID=3572 RepID=A0AAW1J8Z6_SAPOF